jgi:hypothetical protein
VVRCPSRFRFFCCCSSFFCALLLLSLSSLTLLLLLTATLTHSLVAHYSQHLCSFVPPEATHSLTHFSDSAPLFASCHQRPLLTPPLTHSTRRTPYSTLPTGPLNPTSSPHSPSYSLTTTLPHSPPHALSTSKNSTSSHTLTHTLTHTLPLPHLTSTTPSPPSTEQVASSLEC